MPLANDVEKSWDGWLIEGQGGQEKVFQEKLLKEIESKKIPESKIKTGTQHVVAKRQPLH